jgi:hypothetical protein
MNFVKTMVRCKTYEAARRLYASIKRNAPDTEVAISHPKRYEYYVEILVVDYVPCHTEGSLK